MDEVPKRLKGGGDDDEDVSPAIPWMKKYELDTMDEAAMNSEAVFQLVKLTEEDEGLPQKILLVGPKFGGMITALMSYARIMLSNNYEAAFLQLSPSDGGASALFGKLTEFLKAKIELPEGRFRIVAVHAFDTMTETDQEFIWRISEIYSQASFFLMPSSEARVIPAVRDGFKLIRFGNEEYLLKKLKDVSETEKINFEEKTLRGIIVETDGNFAQAVADLQDIVNGKVSNSSFAKENPMENDIVISNILSFLKLEDLKTCRFINHQWNRNCCLALKQSSRPLFKLKLDRFNEVKRDEILSILETESKFPLARNTEFSGCFFETVGKKGNLIRYLNAVSPVVTNLKVGIGRRGSKHYIKYPDDLSFPHLKSVDIAFGYNLETFLHPELFRRIFQNPKLVEVSISAYNIALPVFQSFVDLLKEEQVASRLTSFNLDATLNNEKYDLLIGSGLNLKKCRIKVDDSAAGGVSRFLKSQSESLEHLELDDNHADFASTQFQLQSLRLPRLKEFTLNIEKDNIEIADKEHISYNEQFPALEHLKFVSPCYQRHVLDVLLHSGRSGSDVGLKVKTLSIITKRQEPVYNDFVQTIENASHLFPNLTKVEISNGLDLGLLKRIYAGMRNLQELILGYEGKPVKNLENYEIDHLFMGVQWKRKKECLADDGTVKLDFNEDKSLLALTELKTLRIRSPKNNIIGETVCRSVFMKMDSLKVIDLFGQWQGKMGGVSSELLEEMREKILIL